MKFMIINKEYNSDFPLSEIMQTFLYVLYDMNKWSK